MGSAGRADAGSAVVVTFGSTTASLTRMVLFRTVPAFATPLTGSSSESRSATLPNGASAASSELERHRTASGRLLAVTIATLVARTIEPRSVDDAKVQKRRRQRNAGQDTVAWGWPSLFLSGILVSVSCWDCPEDHPSAPG